VSGAAVLACDWGGWGSQHPCLCVKAGWRGSADHT
jgi:hypothetical protein